MYRGCWLVVFLLGVSGCLGRGPALRIEVEGDGEGRVTSQPAGIDCGEACAMLVDVDETITLTAEPALDAVFAGWEGGGCRGTGLCVLNLAADTRVTARFVSAPRPRHALTVSREGNGTVFTPGGPEIACGNDCSESYLAGTEVTLHAMADADWQLAGWEGAPACGSSADCMLTITAPVTITTRFVRSPVTLTVISPGNGTITSLPAGIACGATCTHAFAFGSSVTLLATPALGWAFQSWTGCASMTATCAVTIDQPRTVTAVFAPAAALTLDVTLVGPGRVTSGAGGGIDCGADCTQTYGGTTTVTLTATPDVGAVFLGWGGACSGTSSTCTVTVNPSRTVTAMFAPPSSLIVSVDGPGTVSSPETGACASTCTTTLPSTSTVTLTATPGTGAVFTGWMGACSGTSSTCTVSLAQSQSVFARFAFDHALLILVTGSGTVSWSPTQACMFSCGTTAVRGSVVTYTATPGAGWTFLGWGGACTGTSTTCTLTVTSDAQVMAVFGDGTAKVTIVKGGSGAGDVFVPPDLNCSWQGYVCSTSQHPAGTVLTVTATPTTDSTFAGWGGACSGTSPTCTFTVGPDSLVAATFTRSSACGALVVEPGTWGLFHFDDGAGTIASEETGFHADGQLASPAWTTGRFGGGLQFVETEQDRLSSNGFWGLSTFSIEAWIRPQDNDGDAVIVRSNSVALSLWLLGGKPAIRVGNGALWHDAIAPGVVQTGAWTYLAGTYDGATLRLYVNGVLVSSTAYMSTATTAASSLWIGGMTSDAYFGGVIDEVRISALARSAATIAGYYAAAASCP